jgi:uracil-DNA glycosylase
MSATPKQSSLASFFTGVKKVPIGVTKVEGDEGESKKRKDSENNGGTNNTSGREVKGEETLKKKAKADDKVADVSADATAPVSTSTKTTSAVGETAVVSSVSTITDQDWSTALSKALSAGSYTRLTAFLEGERIKKTVDPPPDETFSAFNLTPLSTIKVVIVGQDPYHGPNQGHGLSFSVKPGVAVPPSLRNIFKELLSEGLLSKKPDHGYLRTWAEQGVFMLNAVLSVRQGEANSHAKKGWEEFTSAAISHLAKEKEGLVFLCWGKPAATMCANVNRSRHCVINSSHPSPLGATKTDKPFIGSDCFKRCNEYLVEKGGEGIRWDSVNE